MTDPPDVAPALRLPIPTGRGLRRNASEGTLFAVSALCSLRNMARHATVRPAPPPPLPVALAQDKATPRQAGGAPTSDGDECPPSSPATPAAGDDSRTPAPRPVGAASSSSALSSSLAVATSPTPSVSPVSPASRRPSGGVAGASPPSPSSRLPSEAPRDVLPTPSQSAVAPAAGPSPSSSGAPKRRPPAGGRLGALGPVPSPGAAAFGVGRSSPRASPAGPARVPNDRPREGSACSSSGRSSTCAAAPLVPDWSAGPPGSSGGPDARGEGLAHCHPTAATHHSAMAGYGGGGYAGAQLPYLAVASWAPAPGGWTLSAPSVSAAAIASAGGVLRAGGGGAAGMGMVAAPAAGGGRSPTTNGSGIGSRCGGSSSGGGAAPALPPSTTPAIATTVGGSVLVVYGPAERQAAIRRFQEKKKRALCPRIRYSVRKKLADVRPRKHGRFYKPADAAAAAAPTPRVPPVAAGGDGMVGVSAATAADPEGVSARGGGKCSPVGRQAR